MKSKKNNKKYSKEDGVYKILDNQYFHTSVSYALYGMDEIDWVVYYSNLPTKVYFSDENKAILDSNRNTIEDIYKLKQVFEKEKNKEFEKNIIEYSKIMSSVFKLEIEAKKEISFIVTYVLLSILSVNIINFVFFGNVYFSLFCMLLTSVVAILGMSKIKKFNKKLVLAENRIKENYIKQKIRQQGLFFVERIKV